MGRWRVPAAGAVAGLAFALYHATLLPGVDFGDTGSFQTMVGSPIITPRDGYPLYFALGAAFLRFTGGDPAHSLNLLSAVEGAIACGILSLVAGEISGSTLAGTGSALLFAGSYTFWSQAVIAEVYALHMLFVSLTLWLLLGWEQQPTLRRLSLFFAIYALGFGNHLSMILLAPAYTLVILLSAPRGWRSMFAPSVILLAMGAATAGALQYAWNVRTLWFSPIPPHGALDALGTAWSDITKADWRETMMMQVPHGMAGDHLSMYLFDVVQQFGWIGPALAAVGLARLAATRWRRAMLIGGVYLANAAFAYSYNVGDAHVFYLPSHLMIALLVAPGIVCVADLAVRKGAVPLGPLFDRAAPIAPAASGESLASHRDGRGAPLARRDDREYREYLTEEQRSQRRGPQRGSRVGVERGCIARRMQPDFHHGLLCVALIVYAGARMYRDYPALDRSHDRRPTEVLSALTADLDDQHAILLTDLNWQVDNGLSYFAKAVRPDVAYAHMPDVWPYAPALVRDNLDIGREVALTARARATLTNAYGPLIPTVPDARVFVPGISDLIGGLAPSTRYVLAVLKPSRGFRVDLEDLSRAAGGLTDGQLRSVPDGDYAVIAGTIGERPAFVTGSNRPFRHRVNVGGVAVDIRMESWLAADTIRRMGFGHVIAAHRHTLIVERGVSFVAFDQAGRSIRSGYAASIFAPEPRYLCYR